MPLPTRIVTATFQGRSGALVQFVLQNTVSDGTSVEEAGTVTMATLDGSGNLSQALLCQDPSLNADPVYTWRPVFGSGDRVVGVVIPAGTGSVGLLALSPVGAPLTPTQFTTLEGLITTEQTVRAAADTANAAAITSEATTARAAEAGKVAKAGDTMTGPLVLPGNPTLLLQAAPKQYADSGDSATLSSAQTYTDGKVTALVNGAPGLLDTLGEIATQLQSDESAAGALTTAVAGKAQKLVRTAVKTGAYAAAAGDLVPCDTTSGAFTVTLPNAPAVGTRVAVKIVTLGAGNFVTIACAGSDVFNKAGGATTAVLQLLGHAMNLQYDTGGIWTVVADDVPKSQLDGTYVPLLDATITTVTYNTDGTVASVAYANGVTISYTYNADGTVHTSSDGTTTRTFTYNTDGTIASVA